MAEQKQMDLAESDVEFERMPLRFQDHNWTQEGYTLICRDCPVFDVSAHGQNIPVGKMLVGERGRWRIAPELVRMDN